MLGKPKIKVVNLLNQNEGLLQDYQITWSEVTGAEGYLIFKSYVPYGTYEQIGKVEAGVTSDNEQHYFLVAVENLTSITQNEFSWVRK